MFNIPEHALGFLTEHSTLGRDFLPHKAGIIPLSKL
jgi:deoxycytidine triphosphate deaminase